MNRVNITHTPMAPYLGLLDSMKPSEKMAVATFLVSSLPNVRIVETGADNNVREFDEEYMQKLISLSAPAWKGIGDADEWIHELRGE